MCLRVLAYLVHRVFFFVVVVVVVFLGEMIHYPNLGSANESTSFPIGNF